MTFEHPQAWWLLAIAAPILLLHLHLARRRVVEVSSLELWRGLVPDRAGRGGLRRLRDGLALAFVLAALVAFAASGAGPVTGSPPSPPRRLAIVLDASASMTARSASGRSRFDEARDAAVAALAKAAPQDDVTVWLAGEDAVVAVEPTHDAGKAAAALGGLAPTLAPPGLASATRLAVRAARGVSGRPATVLVLTDAVGAGSLRDTAGGEVDLRVGVVDRDRVASNAGIVAFDVDPADESRLLCRVATTDGPPSARSLEFAGVSVPLDFDATGSAAATLPLGALRRTGGLVEVRLRPGDDFTQDDSARLMLPALSPLAVAVVAAIPSPFLVEALRAMPGIADPARTVLVAPGAPASAFEGIDVVIADGAPPPPGRPSLVFGAGTRRADRPLLWGVGAHPILAGVDLAPLRIERSALVDPAPGETTIVASAAGAVGVAGDEGGVRRVAFGFRPDASTLPLEAAFPLLVRNSLRWLAQPAVAPRYVVAGEPVEGGDGAVAPLPGPGGASTLRVPTGAVTTVRWVAPMGFRLSPPAPAAALSPDEAVGLVPPRADDRDTRERFGPRLAAIGAVLLAVGALLLGAGARAREAAVPALAASR